MKAVLAMAGCVLIVAGVIFLLRSAWLAMVVVYGPTLTAGGMGLGLVVLGGILVAIGMQRTRVVVPPQPVNPLASVVTAFVQGYDAAQAMKKR